MSHEPVTIYTPESALARPAALIREMFRDLLRCRELAWQLATRDIRAQYRQTALGYVWLFVVPGANAAIWLFMRGAGVVTVTPDGMTYTAFVITGTILWSIFVDAVSAPLQQATSAKAMLAKINFPREALLVSGVYQTCFSAVIRLVVLTAVLLLLGLAPGWQLLFVPIAVMAIILTGTTIGVLLTPVGLLYADIGRGLPLILQLLMFLSPVVYPIPKSGWAATLLENNPLTPLIATSRSLLVGQTPEMLGQAIVVFGGVAVLLFVAWGGYRLAMPILIERMSA